MGYSKFISDPDIESIDYYTTKKYTPTQTWSSCYFDGTIMAEMTSNMQTLGYNINSEDELLNNQAIKIKCRQTKYQYK